MAALMFGQYQAPAGSHTVYYTQSRGFHTPYSQVSSHWYMPIPGISLPSYQLSQLLHRNRVLQTSYRQSTRMILSAVFIIEVYLWILDILCTLFVIWRLAGSDCIGICRQSADGVMLLYAIFTQTQSCSTHTDILYVVIHSSCLIYYY